MNFGIASELSQAVNDLSDLGLVVRNTVGAEASAVRTSSLVEHAEQVRHFLKGSVLGCSRANDLEASTDCRTDRTVHSIGLFGLKQTLFARFMLRHLKFSG